MRLIARVAFVVWRRFVSPDWPEACATGRSVTR